jgi:hypothetical protein
MKLKVKTLKMAMDEFTKGTPEGTEVEVTMRQENFEEGKLCDCVSFTTVHKELHNGYDQNRNDTIVTKTVEIFPESEGQPPKVTVIRTRDVS